MLFDSQKLTNGLIIYSALISDFERLDFKNDALAGIRANYFNSDKKPQSDKSEISLDDKTYNISYRMYENEPLSWKVTRNNQPFQSVKKTTGGIYSVIFYRKNGIIYKRAFFDKAHSWLRTEYFDSNRENVKSAVLSPKTVMGITVLRLERIGADGERSRTILYPSESVPTKRCTGLIYSNMGMLWYDEMYKPEDLSYEEKFDNGKDNDGFEFYNSDETVEQALEIAKAEYLEETACDYEKDENTGVEVTANQEPEQTYSAYEKIENILTEAHKTNKDLFGEIINQTSGNLYEQDFDETALEDNIQEKAEETALEDDARENIEESAERDTTEEIKGAAKSETEQSDNNFVSEEATEDYDNKELPDRDVIIHTRSGRYAYYGEVDENNKRTGRGRTVTPQGLTAYDGEYLDDQRNGFGVCYYKEGNINYVGNWKNGKREGCGVGYRLSDGTMHIGKWNDNSPNGCGARFDCNGNFIDICFYNKGVRNGKSVSFDENGKIVIKNWKDGEPVSEFVVDDEG